MKENVIHYTEEDRNFYNELHNAFVYDDGILYWKHPRSNRIKPGDIAGVLWTNNKTGYSRWKIGFNGKKYHRSLLVYVMHYGHIPTASQVIDHINNTSTNDRIENLRVTTQHQNTQNKSKSRNKTNGKYKGVFLTKNGRWKTQIVVNGRCVYLGTFDCEETAAKEYNKAATHYFGEYAKLNELRA